jgi:hypothetical protein
LYYNKIRSTLFRMNGKQGHLDKKIDEYAHVFIRLSALLYIIGTI